jgi:acyl carrier protein
MNYAESKEKLLKCFSSVFPELNSVEIESASIETTNGWDSIAQVTLLTLVSEEFGLEVDFEKFEDATSFSGFLTLIGETASHGYS